MGLAAGRIIASSGFVFKKTNYFDRLNLIVWFLQLVISFVIALS